MNLKIFQIFPFQAQAVAASADEGNLQFFPREGRKAVNLQLVCAVEGPEVGLFLHNWKKIDMDQRSTLFQYSS